MLPIRGFDHEPRKSLRSVAFIVALGLGGFATTSIPSFALSPAPSAALASHTKTASGDVIEVRAVARRGAVAVGPRGGAVARRTTVVRPGFHGAGTRVVRPA